MKKKAEKNIFKTRETNTPQLCGAFSSDSHILNHVDMTCASEFIGFFSEK